MAPPVSPALRLPVALHRLRVGLPVLPLIIGMASAPFLLAIPADLVVHGVGFNLATVIIPPMAPLTVWAPTNDLLRMKTGRLKELLAVAAKEGAHQTAPGSRFEPSRVSALRCAVQKPSESQFKPIGKEYKTDMGDLI